MLLVNQIKLYMWFFTKSKKERKKSVVLVLQDNEAKPEAEIGAICGSGLWVAGKQAHAVIQL